MANVCPLVSMQGMVWYSVRYEGVPAFDDLICSTTSGVFAPWTFSATPSPPTARNRNFLIISARVAAVAVAVADEVAVAVADMASLRYGTRTGML